MRSRFWWKYARGRRSIKGISQTLLPARCFTTERFIFLFIHLFIERKYRRKIFRVEFLGSLTLFLKSRKNEKEKRDD